jgi:hypothetical protein
MSKSARPPVLLSVHFSRFDMLTPYAMFRDYWKYQWVLEVYRYNGLEELLASLKEHVIEPAERKAIELAKLRAQEFEKQ